MSAELLGRHGGFILASYAAAILVMGGLVWTSVARYRAVKRRHAAALGADHG